MSLENKRIEIPKMIMVGSNAKNVGKTWLCTYLIEKFSKDFKVIAIKAKTLKDDFSMPHFNTKIIDKNGFDIYEEFEVSDRKDTTKMRLVGAKKAFFIQSKPEKLEIAISHLLEEIENADFVVCESNNLIDYIKPSLFLMCTTKNPAKQKKNSENLKLKADFVLNSDGQKFDFDIKKIKVDKINKSWFVS